MKIALIGYGNMGSAIYRGLANIFPEEDIHICDKSPQKGLKNYHININNVLGLVDVVIIAVKPQQFEELSKSLEGNIKDKLVISIMAGVTIAKIKKLAGAGKVVRAMPNLAASVGESLTGWVAGRSASQDDKTLAARIFSSFGTGIELKNEKMIDSLTALSGSGPAYFFYLCELLQKKAVKMGFNAINARTIAEKTFTGSAKLMGLKIKEAEEWRNAVTSKGGTTEAALEYMEKHGLAEIIDAAVDNAKERAAELNK